MPNVNVETRTQQRPLMQPDSATVTSSFVTPDTKSFEQFPENGAPVVQHYFIPRHVYLCISEGNAVFLDLRRDRYIGLDSSQVRILANAVPGILKEGSDGRLLTADAMDFLQFLEKDALLTSDSSTGKPFLPISLPTPTERLVRLTEILTQPVRIIDVLRFSISYSTIRILLHFASFEHVLRRAELRQRSGRARATAPEDLTSLRRMTAIFWRIRPFFYADKDRCVLDSLVLIEFLSRYDLYPTLVLGIKSLPFMAHMWVQQDQFVLNGNPTAAQMFTPLLAI